MMPPWRSSPVAPESFSNRGHALQALIRLTRDNDVRFFPLAWARSGRKRAHLIAPATSRWTANLFVSPQCNSQSAAANRRRKP